MRVARHVAAALLTAIAMLGARPAAAGDLFVDNREGDDIFDGRSQFEVNAATGPVRTIRRALQRVRPGDTVHIANHGVPYVESLEIVGARFSGGFRLEGNGAVVSGLKEVPHDAWKALPNGVWKFTPRRKAFYQLVSGDRALPEFVGAAGPAAIPAGQWAAWHGSIYYHVPPAGPALAMQAPLGFAAEEVGITLLDVDNVVIHNLELRHFRLDGVNVHDRCKNIILDQVKLVENGRAGLAVGGCSLVGIKDSEISGNRVAQVLNAEVAQTEIISTKLASAAGNPIRKTGGHVLVEGEEVRE
ncbi:MAG: right-handed parallel beta-helix repeat-containing protein [Planctomycetia bacterium]|nr:right-handed parallel beta-helix repeat-containing protein [Planctomycetia bacterium]